MAPPVTRIYDTCQQLLDAVVAGHTGTLPERRYVSAGAPAWDCELVAVWCERTFGVAGDPAVEVIDPLASSAGHTMRAGTFVVTIARCTAAVVDANGDQITLPSVDEEEAAAAELYQDAQAVINALVAAERAGDLPGCHGVAFESWGPLGPEGGFVAGELRVRVGLSSGL